MNQERIDRLIPLAFKILAEDTAKGIFIDDKGEKKIKSEYKGYMSSIGVSIGHGLIKTLTAYSKKGGSEGDKTITLDLIKSLLIKDGYYSANEAAKNLLDLVNNRLEKNTSTFYRLSEEDRILEATTTYKLVFDTFKKYDPKNKKSEVQYAG